MSKKLRILVLCTGNSCRSQMAEGYFRHYGGEKVNVKSAGLEPKGVNPRAIEVMNEAGIDISGHSSNNLKEYLNEDFDFVITVCDNAAENCPVWPSKTTPDEGRRPFDKLRMTPPETNDRVRNHTEPVLASRHGDEARLPIRLHWSFPDPAEATGTESEIMEIFRKVRDDIGEKIKGWITQTIQT